jgi:hypothetical protein
MIGLQSRLVSHGYATGTEARNQSGLMTYFPLVGVDGERFFRRWRSPPESPTLETLVQNSLETNLSRPPPGPCTGNDKVGWNKPEYMRRPPGDQDPGSALGPVARENVSEWLNKHEQTCITNYPSGISLPPLRINIVFIWIPSFSGWHGGLWSVDLVYPRAI